MSVRDRALALFTGKTVGIVGLGREGLALAEFFCSLGVPIVATDDKPLAALRPEVGLLDGKGATVLAGGMNEAVLEADCCFVSPGVPLDLPLIVRAREKKVPLWNEPGLLLALCPSTTVGVTGSSGKSTTSALLAAMLEASGTRVFLGGNIGVPLLPRVDDMLPGDVVVLELSSFQLELVRTSPVAAVLTNLTPNHLERHHSMGAYAEAKARIFRYQGPDGLLVLNAEDEWCRRFAPRAAGRVDWFSRAQRVERGAFVEGDDVMVRWQVNSERVCTIDEIRLLGRHNVENVLAACAVAAGMGVPVSAIREAVTSFRGLPHRLELAAVVNGVSYYNDSIATTPERSTAALRSFDAPLVVLAGGRDKHLPWDQWVDEVSKRSRCVVLFGEAGPTIAAHLIRAGVSFWLCDTLEEAVAQAQALARPGDVVLMSPGGTSFDEFRDFEERGERFRELVMRSVAE